jgi:hypothetical protein
MIPAHVEHIGYYQTQQANNSYGAHSGFVIREHATKHHHYTQNSRNYNCIHTSI